MKLVKTLSIRAMREALPSIEETLKEEGELLIARRGQVVARVLPLQPKTTLPSLRGLRAKMKRPKVSSATLIRQDRDAR